MIFTSWLVLILLSGAIHVSFAKITNVVLFGDSYTADGGVQWPWYLGLYGNFTIWNYAVGGAVCSNSLTPLNGVPDVSSGQKAWFIEDHITDVGTSKQKLHLDPEEFTVVMFVGTNDVGINSFVTGSQSANISLSDVANCQLSSIRNLHALGARNFILNSLIPLQLTGLYNGSSDPVIYWPIEHNGTAWHIEIFKLVSSLNRILKDGVAALNEEWKDGEGKVEFFDTYGFFEEVYHHLAKYFNGSITPDVVGHCHQCPVATDWHFCGIGDCTPAERDSYMWWDELHPSEQTGRNLAAEILKKIEGKSKY
ncbi:carbohydrate esterase family 16 protein [Athelia psychrophila]|uniref:Carbohydrate esterase family 16 protein n=1 Tax=Athelia psychrophila TaxID=1759441 RepID=A0A166LRM5_9AGAM|nr:carbohydrate esterase family 16 protein [Fibularhizoctonia sp. CBS 109695]